MRSVALDKGYRIVAIGEGGKILGALSLTGAPRLHRFGSSLSDYSNKVRSLPRSLFAGTHSPDGKVHEFWLLVPVAEDRSMTRRMEASVADAGLTMDTTAAIYARFDRRMGAGFALKILSVTPAGN